jgi:hypothetical protein
VCCQVEDHATSWPLVQRSPTDCGASLCVITKPRERGHSPRWAAEPEKIIIIKHTGYEHCHYETPKTIQWTNKIFWIIQTKDGTGHNNFRKQWQLSVTNSKQISSLQAEYDDVQPKKKKLLFWILSKHNVQDNGPISVNRWSVPALSLEMQDGPLKHPMAVSDKFPKHYISASHCYIRVRYEIIVTSGVPEGPSFPWVHRRID